MAWTAFQMQKIAYDKKIMEQNICRGADPSRNTARWAGVCVTLLFSGGGKTPVRWCTVPPEKSMPDQPSG